MSDQLEQSYAEFNKTYSKVRKSFIKELDASDAKEGRLVIKMFDALDATLDDLVSQALTRRYDKKKSKKK